MAGGFPVEGEGKENEKQNKQKEEVFVNIPNVHDDSLIHAAIPFLPVIPASICFLFNVVVPGSGKNSFIKFQYFIYQSI